MAAVVLVGVIGVTATGAFGLNSSNVGSAVTASSLPGGFQSAATATYQITPTQTTCSQFQSGTAGTLSQIQYALKGNIVNSVNPGVFFYWATVTPFTTGTQTHTITQTTSPTYNHFFAVASGTNVYDSSCNVVQGATISPTSSTGTNTVTFQGTAGQTYFIGIKYSPNSLVGAPKPSATTVTYTFTTDQQMVQPASIDFVKKH